MSLLKTGLLGGTFNPVHSGHIELGRRSLNHFGLDKVYYMLSANPPHKQGECRVDKDLRWEMLNEALRAYPELVPSDVEMRREGLSWSLETVKYLKEENPDEIYYFISGSEGFLKIKSWRRYRELLDEVVFIVAVRKEEHVKQIKTVLDELNVPIYDDVNAAQAPGVLLFSYESDTIAYSSTKVRDVLSEGGKTGEMVSESVKEIIKENNLYER